MSPPVSAPAGMERQAVDLGEHGRRAEADRLFKAALDMDLSVLGAEHPGVAVDHSDFAAELSAEGRHDEAERHAGLAVAILRAHRATALQGADGPEAALTQAKAQLDHADPMRFIFETYLDVAWKKAQASHADDPALRGRAFAAAQDMAGSASARAMAMAAARTATTSGPLAAILRDQQALTARVVALDGRLLALSDQSVSGPAAVAARGELHRDTQRLVAINHHIDRDFPAYRAIISPQPLDIAQVQAALGPDEGLLLLAVSGTDVHSFAIGPHGSAWNRVADGAKSVSADVARLHCQVDPIACPPRRGPSLAVPTRFEALGYGRYDLGVAYGLYARLVAPVEAPLAHAKTLYVVATGFVGDLPLAMLVSTPPAAGIDDADPAILAKMPWLADRYAFVHLPAVAGLRLRMVRSRTGEGASSLDGYGDPILGDSHATMTRGMTQNLAGRPATSDTPILANPLFLRTLPSLPGTRRELTSMARSMGAAETALHLQGQATETEVKHDPELSRAAIVVFATHGILPGEIGDNQEPGLILTPPDIASAEDDGILTASEASQLSLTADWVILSACNTASSQGAEGPDNLSSLARGFLYAGTHALLASHWRVSDDATAALTVETLSIRHTRRMTGARALQSAMKAVRTGHRSDGSLITGWHDAWAHPAAWAAFSYVADHDD